MVNIGSNGNRIAYGIKHFNLDEVVDLVNLNTATLTPGSTAFVISTSTYYMLNGSKKWIEIKSIGGNNGSGGGTDDDFIYDGGSIDGSDPEDTDDKNVYDGGSIDGSDPI